MALKELVNIGAANFTIDAWVQVPAASANRLDYIVNKFDSTQNKGYALYIVSPGVAGNERLEFKWGDGTTVSAAFRTGASWNCSFTSCDSRAR
ncbi:MAG TPA: hypothetical protein VMS31_18840 [Pyrinomonadaceae bacterium]|nr:hypothetical protein [Pyrinomonadaceae bacterium]